MRGNRSSAVLCCFLTICSVVYGRADRSFLITTVVGNGTAGFSGDSGPATAASLRNPRGVAVDAAGNLYIADTDNHRVRRVTPAGIISTVAGNGTPGFSGDGGPATSASLANPRGVAADAAGNVYVADTDNRRVRRVTPAGIITTVAGGTPGPSVEGGPATGASLGYTTGVAVDAVGNLYIADTRERVYRVTPAGIISAVAGNGTAGFSGDGGPATAASMGRSDGVAVDPSGIVYIADYDNNRVRRVTPAGIISTAAGNGTLGFGGDGGPATAASMGRPSGVAVDAAGNLYVADTENHRVRRVTPAGIMSTVVGNGTPGFSGDGGPATAASVGRPSGVAVDAAGGLYITELYGNRIRKLIPSPSTVGCMYSIDPTAQSIGTGGGSGRVNVIAARGDCPWLASSNAEWVTITSGAGMGNGTVTFNVAPNRTASARTAVLAIAGHTFTVTQPGATCSLSITPTSVALLPAATTGTVAVSATLPDCPWTAGTNANWLFVTAGASGKGGGTVTYAVAENDGGLRTGTMTIAGQTFTVTQAPKGASLPTISTAGVVNAASLVGGLVVPGGFVSIFGSGIGPTQPVSSGSLDRGLAGAKVLVNGIEAFLTYVSAGQINALVPYGVAGYLRADVRVEYQPLRSNTVTLPVMEAGPGIFTADGSGTGAAVVVNEDGSLNSASNPAPRGSVVAFWATGQGQTDPPGIDGRQPQPPIFPTPVLPVFVTIRGISVAAEDIVFAGLIYAGVMQVNVKIPETVAPASAVELLLTVGKSTSRKGVTVAVR